VWSPTLRSGKLVYDLRTAAGLSRRALADRMGTTEPVISRLEEGGGALIGTISHESVALAIRSNLG
jgi:transcriptional regulator with XRE-family HTH domain